MRLKILIIFLFSFIIVNNVFASNSTDCIKIPSELEYSLFGGVTYLPKNQKYFLDYMTGDNDYFYEIGAKLSYYFDNGFTLTGHASKQGDQDLDFDYALLRYSNYITTDLTYDLEIGKILSGVGFMNEGRFNPNARWTIIMPQGMYTNNLKRWSSGGYGGTAKLSYNLNGWDLSLRSSISKKNIEDKKDFINTFFPHLGGTGEYDPGYGLGFKFSTTSPLNTFNSYLMYGRIRGGDYSPNITNQPGFAKLPQKVKDYINSQNYPNHINLYQAGVQFNFGNLSLLAEGRIYELETAFWHAMGEADPWMTSSAFNAAARYWWGDKVAITILGFATYSDLKFDWDGSERAEKTGKSRYLYFQNDFYTSVGYRFNDHIKLRVEGHYMQGSSMIENLPTNQNPPKDWWVWATQLCFEF